MTVAGYLAVDSGGSGLRVAVGVPGRTPSAQRETREPVRTGAGGIDPAHLMSQLIPLTRELATEAGVDELGTAVVGAAGFATLGDALRAELPDALARVLGVRRVALAADAVTAYAGALGSRPGAVLAAGTGLIAIGTDLTGWRRADGWGHLLGDCGGGAWIGRAGLEAALRAHDGRAGGSAALLRCAEKQFGPVCQLPGLLYPRTDRAAVLASFAPRVADLSADDPVAADILRAAARHMADSAAAVCPVDGTPEVALTGGLSKMGDPLLVPLREELTRRLPHARQVPPEGDPLHGAVRIATELAAGRLTLPGEPTMLHVTAATRKRADKSGRIPLTCTLPEQDHPGNQ
ncbi:N-acetylglucosamine kinase [Streptomyces griseofuscus]|uniref:BadF/BadG/BcrA/BcrD ATPase family protein n=1 Tax=Streptomyces griseofuscus TaxID=146922 RepID=A0A7H1Q9N2_9ACTN|nr:MULTISPECIES: BadF/BadG/BcrA/BcrD ATPase family protein [Streptomyces]MBA9044298.1 N-acetylglucosamine kinase-like BadF-type ATPase [Streptomyces murinus]QNT97012.1 BadF/BadG/BcrA/BcrD ATPase family protein [Streptomyces griseofuscus]BBC97610.1 ATPase [Streptomyces rochei]